MTEDRPWELPNPVDSFPDRPAPRQEQREERRDDEPEEDMYC